MRRTDAPRPGSTRRLLVWLVAIATMAAALPAGASSFGSPELTCRRSWDLIQNLLKRHISFRALNPELKERAIDAYIEGIDPSKSLFLASEVDKLRRDLTGVFFGIQNGECETLDGLQADLVKRYERMEKEVRAFVSSPDYALDEDVRLILDPEKRGHPFDDAARRDLVERLVHFQMSNYLSSEMEVDKAKEKLIHRYELMTRRARELEPRDTYSNFLNAFASALDPHSTYYPPEAVEDFEIQMRLSLDGIGVALSSKDGYSIVERIIPGGATDKAGVLEPGDKIIAVAQEGEDFVDIIDMSLRDVVSMIRGERGTKVRLTVLRKADTTERLEVEIERDKVTIEDAAATLDFEEVEIGGRKRKLAILDLPTFYGDPDPSKRQSSRDVRDLLRQVKEAKADGLLLDLSRNGGGKLESSVDIAGLFIRDGGIVAVKNVFQEVQFLEDQDEDIVYDGPLVILTSRITASASEIVAGAMKDYRRAVIVGDDHTFGKGTVQSFIHQPGRLGAIKVTTALFFRPGGASTQHSGVAADVVLPSLFATDELGERYTPYSLDSQTIAPFLGPAGAQNGIAPISTGLATAWKPIDAGLIAELSRRSAARIAQDEEFKKIEEQLAKVRAEDDVIHLAELIRERKEAEAKDADGTTDETVVDGETKGASDADASESKTPAADGDDESYTAPEDEKPTPQRLEALRILADLVELEESPRASWHASQSASPSESLSSPQ
ncbi:MAG: carboxy terminal-processing peptidase [Spirochaetaceae bacterium]|nr:carboxy terminal-processing peptidase [Myxococcales bacterium]MCB9724837.1 carboxy terminal-processing peptidase [Spirochaetaceae bacterium]